MEWAEKKKKQEGGASAVCEEEGPPGRQSPRVVRPSLLLPRRDVGDRPPPQSQRQRPSRGDAQDAVGVVVVVALVVFQAPLEWPP